MVHACFVHLYVLELKSQVSVIPVRMLAAYVLKTFDSHLTELFSRFSDLDHAERYFLTSMVMNCVCTLLQALLKSASVFLPLSTVFSISMQLNPLLFRSLTMGAIIMMSF